MRSPEQRLNVSREDFCPCLRRSAFHWPPGPERSYGLPYPAFSVAKALGQDYCEADASDEHRPPTGIHPTCVPHQTPLCRSHAPFNAEKSAGHRDPRRHPRTSRSGVVRTPAPFHRVRTGHFADCCSGPSRPRAASVTPFRQAANGGTHRRARGRARARHRSGRLPGNGRDPRPQVRQPASAVRGRRRRARRVAPGHVRPPVHGHGQVPHAVGRRQRPRRTGGEGAGRLLTRVRDGRGGLDEDQFS